MIFPYTDHLVEPRLALIHSGWPYVQHDVSGSDRAYFDLLSGLWSDQETFCIIEHDVVINYDSLVEFAECPHDWCSFPYEYMGKPTCALGCSRFSTRLIARNRDAMRRVGVMHDPNHPKRHWCRLDANLRVVLELAGEIRHEHTTMVQHLSDGCAHGCTTNA